MTLAKDTLAANTVFTVCPITSCSARCPGGWYWLMVRRTQLKGLFIEKARELGILIEKMKVEPDRIDLVVRSKPAYAVHFVVHQLKAYSFRILRKEYDFIRSQFPSIWTRFFFAESIGRISEETVLGYIENQKKA